MSGKDNGDNFIDLQAQAGRSSIQPWLWGLIILGLVAATIYTAVTGETLP